MTHGMLISMKATFSLPDDLFAQLASLAAERHEPRSALVAAALAEFFRQERLAETRRQLAEAYPPDEPSNAEDEAMLQFQRRILRARIQAGEWEW